MTREPSKTYTMALLRNVSARMKQIDQEIISVGVALSEGLITASKAREMSEDIAPGCLNAVALDLILTERGE